MNPEYLSEKDRAYLLDFARRSIQHTLENKKIISINVKEINPKLFEPGVVFVTLTIDGELRGCVGALESYQPLIDDVREHAIAAALHDYRFPPLTVQELPKVKIEISRLTQPQVLDYQSPNELISLLKPGIDGVIIQDGRRKATFLPQVWEKLPNPETFLSHLCDKMGSDPNTWRYKKLDVKVYQVEMFHE